MTRELFLLAALALAGCVAEDRTPSQRAAFAARGVQPVTVARAIAVLDRVCTQSRPGFTGATEAAVRAGLVLDAGRGRYYSRTEALSVQIDALADRTPGCALQAGVPAGTDIARALGRRLGASSDFGNGIVEYPRGRRPSVFYQIRPGVTAGQPPGLSFFQLAVVGTK